MLKKTITYDDYNGTERTEDFYFNFSKAEIVEMELSEKGGLAEHIQAIVKTQDGPEIVKLFKKLVLDAYGQKSADGRRFIKNQDLRDDFSQTEAYSQLFMELAMDADKAGAFVNSIVPADAMKASADANAQPAQPTQPTLVPMQ